MLPIVFVKLSQPHFSFCPHFCYPFPVLTVFPVFATMTLQTSDIALQEKLYWG